MQRHMKFTGILALLVIGCALAAGTRTQSAIGSDEESPTSAEPRQLTEDASRYSNSKTSGRTRTSNAVSASGTKPRTLGRRATTLEQRMKSIRRSISERSTNGLRERKPAHAAVPRSSADKTQVSNLPTPTESNPSDVPPAELSDLNRSSRRTLLGLIPEPALSLTEESAGPATLERPGDPGPLQSTIGQRDTSSLRAVDDAHELDTPGEQIGTDHTPKQPLNQPNALVEVEDVASESGNLSQTAENGPATAQTNARVSSSTITNESESEYQVPSGAEDEIFTSQSPVLRVATKGPRTVVVGKESVYIVKVQNSSDTVANGVIIDVEIPSRAEVIHAEASVGRARYETVGEQKGRVRWNINQVDPHAVEQIAIRLVPRDSRSFELSVNWSFNPNASVARIEVQEPKLEVLLTGPSDILYGENKVYTITVRNPGTGPAENVVLNLLPINRNDTAGVRRLGTLPAGHSERIDIELSAQQPGQIWIRAQAFGDSGLRAEVAEEVLVRRANLEVTLAAPDVKYAGTVAEYDVRVVNTGDASAESVIATAVLPQGSEYVNSGGDSVDFDETSGRVRWSLGSLTPGAQRSVRLKCVLGTPGANRLEVVAEAADELASFQSAVTVVEALADLKLTVEDPRGPVALEDTAVYDVHLVNRGSKPALAVRVYAFFSEGVEPTEIIGGEAQIEPGQVVFEKIDRIGPGQEFQFKISARAVEVGDHIFRAEVTCEDPDTELAAQETTRFYGQVGIKEAADEPQAANGAAAVRR